MLRGYPPKTLENCSRPGESVVCCWSGYGNKETVILILIWKPLKKLIYILKFYLFLNQGFPPPSAWPSSDCWYKMNYPMSITDFRVFVCETELIWEHCIKMLCAIESYVPFIIALSLGIAIKVHFKLQSHANLLPWQGQSRAMWMHLASKVWEREKIYQQHLSCREKWNQALEVL